MSDPRRSEYLTYYVAFSAPPVDQAELVAHWQELALAVVGNVAIRTEGVVKGGWVDAAGLRHVNIWKGPPRVAKLSACEPQELRALSGIGLTSLHRVPEPKGLDFLLQFDFSNRSLPGSEPDVPGALGAFGVTFLDTAARARLNELIVPHLLGITRCGRAACAFIDVGDCWETGFGRVHGSCGILFASFQNRLRRELWLSDPDPPSKLRGVYWVNWLSGALAARLGDRDAFIREYDELNYGQGRELIEVQPDGALLIRLCPDFREFPGHHNEFSPSTMENAVWLHRRFAAAGLFVTHPRTALERRAAAQEDT